MKEVVQQPIESDEELLSQPGSEYMSPAQLDFFRRNFRLWRPSFESMQARPPSIFERRFWFPTRPIAPPLKKSMRLSCAHEIGSESLLRRWSRPLPELMRGSMAIARRRASPLGFRDFLPVPRQRFLLKRKSVESFDRNSSATNPTPYVT